MASSSDGVVRKGGNGRGGKEGEGGGEGKGEGRGLRGGEMPSHRMHRLQPVFEMNYSISPSSSDRSLSLRNGILPCHDVNQPITAESTDAEMRFIDDVTDSDSVDDDVTTETQADSGDRDDECQVLQQTSLMNHLSTSSSSVADVSVTPTTKDSSSPGFSEPLSENMTTVGSVDVLATNHQVIPLVKSPQLIPELRVNDDLRSSSPGVKRRVSEPRVRNLFNTLHDKLTQQRKSDNSWIVEGSESPPRRPKSGTPPPTRKKLSLTPLIGRRKSTAAQINTPSEMAHQEWTAGATPKKSWLKRRPSESSNDSKVSEGSNDRPGKEGEDAEDKSRSGHSPGNESSVTSPGHPSPKQRHLFTFLRLNKDSTTNQSQRITSSNSGSQRFRHGSGGPLHERTAPTRDGPSTPTTLTPFSKSGRGLFATVDPSEGSDLGDAWRRDHGLGLDKQRVFTPGEKSSRRGRTGGDPAGSARAAQATASPPQEVASSSKSKDKNVFRTFIGRVRSMSISHDNPKAFVDLSFTDSHVTSTATPRDEGDDEEEEVTPVPTGIRPSFHRNISLDESTSNTERKSPLWKRRLSRPTKLKHFETEIDSRHRASSVTTTRRTPLDTSSEKQPQTDALDFVLPPAATVEVAENSRHLPAKVHLSQKSTSLPDLLNTSEEDNRKLQAEMVAVDEKKIEKLKTGRRVGLPMESPAEPDRAMAPNTSVPAADEVAADPVHGASYTKKRRSTLADIHTLAVNVFNRRSTSNPGKSQLKLFDSKRDISSRLKHLRLISDSYEVNKLRHFYNENFSYIYYLFHEGFTASELILSTKASRNPQREDMDLVLYTLEKILCVLPELINKRWQCHSLGQIMSKLLRCSAFQKDGMKLFIAWYSILMDNATENCDRIFRSLIPISDRVDLMQNSGSLCFYLEWILKCMVTEAAKVMWFKQEAAFEFLFRKFYQYYVLRIFPDFDATDIYSPSNDVPPRPQNRLTGETSQVSDAYLPLQEVIIRWITEFMQSKRGGTLAEKISFGIVPEKVPKDGPDVLSGTGVSFQAVSPEGQKTYTEVECAIVCSVFYMSQENVNIVLEILHQALLVSLRHSRIAKRVISVYKHWFQSRTKPAFMEEPNEPGTARTLTDRTTGLGPSFNGCQRQSGSSSSNQSVIEGTDVSVGQQRVLQVFVMQSMVVFVRDWRNLNQRLRESSPGLQLLAEQVDLCKTTLGVYRYVAMNVYMTRHTWTHLLTALLRITSYILDSTSPKQKLQSLAGELASTLLQTLIVTWIRANLSFGISKDLWNQLLAVLSSLTDWPEVIQEWAQALEALTAILANVVYNVDANSLSADQSKDQKRRFMKKQSSKEGSEDGPRSPYNVVNGETNRPHQPPLLGHHTSVITPLLQRRLQTSLLTGAKHRSLFLQQQQHVPGLLMMRIPHGTSSPVFTHDHHHLVRSASETNLLSPSSTPKGQLLSEGHVIRLKSLESLDVDQEPSTDRLWTLKKQLLNIADSNATLRHVEETKSLNCSYARADGSCVEDDVQSRSSTLERTTEDSASEDNPLHLHQLSVRTSSPITEDGLAGNIVGQNGNRTNGGCPLSQDASDLDSRKAFLPNQSSLSSILEDGASMASTESFNSDSYPSGTSEMMTPDSSVAGATAYDSPSLSSSSAERNLHSSTDSPSVSGGSPSLYKAGSHPLRLSEDLSSVFLESESDVQLDDLNEDGVACLTSKHGTSGWTPEVAELMWRRVLGLLGDVNSIEDAESHATVFDCLRITTETLLKVHNNMTLQRVHQRTPPILVIAPWVFQALTLPSKYLKGKVLAYRLLCLTMLQPYIDVPTKHLLRFYLVLHRGLVHSSNDIVNVLIKHCASQFFVMPLDGATILLLDFIHAATGIITVSTGQTQAAPTFEAMSLLGSLICFPNHFGKMSVLTPDVEEASMTSVNDVYVKDCIINVLLSNSACRETSQLTSCVRVCALGMYIYEELSHGTMHSKIRDAIEAILDSIKESTDQAVKLTSLDMLSLLTDHSQLLLTEFPDLPRLIIEDLVSYVEHCLLSAKKVSQTINIKVLTSTLFCILTWVMSVPVALLLSVCLSPRSPNSCLLNRIFKVLQVENIPQVVDHNSNYQTSPGNVRQGMEQMLPSAQLSRYDDKMANSESDLLTQDKPTRTTHVKEPGSALVPVVKAVRMHLLNYLGHYPMGLNGTSKLDSQVLECHDITDSDCLGVEILNRPDVQFLVWNECLLISLNELPSDESVDGAGFSSGVVTRNCRVIVRDMSGKQCYDLTSLFPGSVQRSAFESDVCRTSAAGSECHPDIISSSSSSSGGNPDATSIPGKPIDLVDAILEEISRSTPECRLYDGDYLNCIFPLPRNLPLKIDEMMMDCIEEQRNAENDYLSSPTDYDARCRAEPLIPGHREVESNWPFQACRQFMSRMGYLASEHRNQIDLLRKSEQLIRDIRHLDTLICRETHKVAIIYVGGGQEDKTSILLNEHGSQAYEEFITGLGWKVSLEFHEGYMGGLQRNKTNGETAIYFSTSTTEIVFHVSTIMPSSAESDDHQKKVRHLGNDEVHIVWSDHHRRYHRNILNTEFADVIIVIYPLRSGLFHIQILKKPEVGFFGPLFDGAIVDSVVLPSLVRASALNASRTIRAKKQHFQPFYEERDSCVKNIVSKHSELATREEFVSDVFLPGLRHSPSSTLPINNQKVVELVAQTHLRQARTIRGRKPKKPT